MANTLNLGTDGNWATKENSLLGYNSESGNYKPLPFDFTRASNGTFVNKSGLIETAANGVPRIDFLGNTKGALKLEPQRTNYVTQSNDFSGWNGAQFTTPNYAISPDGTQNASRLLYTGASQVLLKTTSLASGVSCSATFYVKGNAGETIQLAAGGIDTMHTLNGSWQRLETNQTSTNSTILLNTFGGATARDLLIYGAQLELGSYATSLINTQGSAVTRVADACSQTPPDGIIGQTEGTMYIEINYTLSTFSSGFSPLYVGEGTYANAIYFSIEPNGILYAVIWENGIREALINMGILSQGINKIALSYEIGSLVTFLNGVNKGSDTPSALPSPNKIYLGQTGTSTLLQKTNVLDVKLYNTRLSNSELQALTQG